VLEHLRPDHIGFGTPFGDGLLDVLLLRVRPDVDRVVLNQQKNGLSPSLTRLSQSIVLSSTSPSKVSIRLRVSGPVFSNFCLPTLPNTGSSVGSSTSVAQAWNTPRGPYFLV
jgi:hypothetical protein